MTTTDRTEAITSSGTCSCGCAPSMAAPAPEAEAAAPTTGGCTCATGDSSGCGPDCACGGASSS